MQEKLGGLEEIKIDYYEGDQGVNNIKRALADLRQSISDEEKELEPTLV